MKQGNNTMPNDKKGQSCNSAYEDFFAVVNKTKDAFIARFQADGYFADLELFDKDKGQGILSEGIGLTALMLLTVAFRSEPSVLGRKDIATITDIATRSFGTIYAEFNKTRQFLVSPLDVGGFFMANNLGYIDTVTWCFSSATLMRYAVRKHILHFDDTMQRQINEMLILSLKALLDSQREDGTWGFATDSKSSRSLYFTYSVSASLADFFDYVMGEIQDTEQKNNTEDNVVDDIDHEILAAFKKEYGYDADTAAQLARTKLQCWLVENALPLLPKVAQCDRLSDEECDLLGIWPQTEIEDLDQKKYYQNLYYAFYLIDMMATAAADLYFKRFVEDESTDAEIVKLIRHYADNNLMSAMDLEYFFNFYPQDDNTDFVLQRDQCHFDRLYTSLVERAIFTSRAQYMTASLTGDRFWTAPDMSGLSILWRHDNNALNRLARTACSNTKLKDPSVAPLSLRANTVYAYYVTEKADIFIDRNFEDVRNDMYDAAEAASNRDKCVDGLWDDVRYNLIVTERAIEAIVDYYDYLCKFVPREVADAAASAPRAQASPLQKALESAIADYLHTPEGIGLVREAAGQSAAPAAKVTAPAGGLTIEALDSLADTINQLTMVSDDEEDHDDDDRAILAWVKLYRALTNYAFKVELKEAADLKGAVGTNELVKSTTRFAGNKKDFFRALYAYMRLPEFTLDNIFDKFLDAIKMKND